MTSWHEICDSNEIPEGDCKVVTINHKDIAIFKIQNRLYAIHDNCTHQNLPLSDGEIEDTSIVCPFHAAKFCLKSGAALTEPGKIPLTCYKVKIENNKVMLEA